MPVPPEAEADEYVIMFSNVTVNLDRATVVRGGKTGFAHGGGV